VYKLKITPLEINKQEFKKVMRGYDTVEVDTFLEMLGKEFEKLLNDNKIYEKKLIELETELKNYKEHESTLKQTLVNVQESTTKSRENSKKEADLIKREAELTAAKLVEEARREVQKLQEEKITLDTQKKSLISRLRHVLTSQMELLDVLEIDDIDLRKLKDRTKKVFSGADKSKPADSEIKIETAKPEKSEEKPQPEPQPVPDKPDADQDSDKVDSDIFKDVFGNDIDIEKFTKKS
jgi:cell division initiation protein